VFLSRKIARSIIKLDYYAISRRRLEGRQEKAEGFLSKSGKKRIGRGAKGAGAVAGVGEGELG